MQFTRKTSYSKSIIGLLIKLFLFAIVFIGIIFLLNKLDFPAPKKTIEKIIPNENFKIVKKDIFINSNHSFLYNGKFFFRK